jgi:hypothetical protein
MDSNDPWYQKLEAKYGFDFCARAGYFQEFNSWPNVTYNTQHIFLPTNSTVIQYSGAFYPMHEGHLSIIKQAIDAVVDRTGAKKGCVVIHVDHLGYRATKGSYSEDMFMKAFSILDQLFTEENDFSYRGFDFELVYEDDMPKGCSRNFTRLYSELVSRGNNTYFLCGGDRANYVLSFIDEGKCIVAGRSSSPLFTEYKKYESDRHWFIEGNNSMSSTQQRNRNKSGQ